MVALRASPSPAPVSSRAAVRSPRAWFRQRRNDVRRKLRAGVYDAQYRGGIVYRNLHEDPLLAVRRDVVRDGVVNQVAGEPVEEPRVAQHVRGVQICFQRHTLFVGNEL